MGSYRTCQDQRSEHESTKLSRDFLDSSEGTTGGLGPVRTSAHNLTINSCLNLHGRLARFVTPVYDELLLTQYVISISSRKNITDYILRLPYLLPSM